MPLHIAPALAAAALLVSLYLFLAASPRLLAGVAAPGAPDCRGPINP